MECLSIPTVYPISTVSAQRALLILEARKIH